LSVGVDPTEAEGISVRYAAKASTRLSKALCPFSAVARDGVPMTPEVVYARMPRLSRCGRTLASWSADR